MARYAVRKHEGPFPPMSSFRHYDMEAAEKAARRLFAREGQAAVFASPETASTPSLVAVVREDALGRVWLDVVTTAAGCYM